MSKKAIKAVTKVITVPKTSDGDGETNAEVKLYMNENITANHEVSVPEKELLSIILDRAPMLPYPTHELRMSNGTTEVEYEISTEEKLAVLNDLFPFKDCPKLDDTLFCIHEQKQFKVRDFRVIRSRDRNMLVSPYFQHSGGMVVDWMTSAAEGASCAILK